MFSWLNQIVSRNASLVLEKYFWLYKLKNKAHWINMVNLGIKIETTKSQYLLFGGIWLSLNALNHRCYFLNSCSNRRNKKYVFFWHLHYLFAKIRKLRYNKIFINFNIGLLVCFWDFSGEMYYFSQPLKALIKPGNFINWVASFFPYSHILKNVCTFLYWGVRLRQLS